MAGAGAGKVAVYAVGRFQPPTIGHQLLINTVARLASQKGGDAFVFVSSNQKPASDNPLTPGQKIDALNQMFPSGVTFVDTEKCNPACGGPEKAHAFLLSKGYTDITLVAGSDRAPIFNEDAPMWKKGKEHGIAPPKFVGLVRTTGAGASAMSGTEARRRARSGEYEGFKEAVQVGDITEDGIKALYDAIRARKGGRRTRRARRTQKRKTRFVR